METVSLRKPVCVSSGLVLKESLVTVLSCDGGSVVAVNTLTWGTHLQWGVQGGRRWSPRAQGQEPRAQSGSNVVASSVKTFESGPHPPQQKKVKRKQNGGGGNIHLARRSCGCSTFRVPAWPLSPRAGLPGCGLP